MKHIRLFSYFQAPQHDFNLEEQDFWKAYRAGTGLATCYKNIALFLEEVMTKIRAFFCFVFEKSGLTKRTLGTQEHKDTIKPSAP